MLLLGWAKGLRHYQSIALLRVTLASQGKLCISNFQGLAALSLWNFLQSSTQEDASRRNSASVEIQGQEVLSLWDAQCCSIRVSIRWRHLEILRPTRNFLKMHLQEPEFFWFTSDVFLKRPVTSYQDSYVKFLPGGLQVKVVLERTTYHVTWGVPQRVPSICKQTLLWCIVMSETPQEPWRSRWPWERDIEQSAPTHAPSHPLHF